MVIGLGVAIAATVLAAELMGWMPKGSRVFLNLAVKQLLERGPDGDETVEAVVAEWEKEVLAEFETFKERPISGLLFSFRVLLCVPQTAAEYFGRDETELDSGPSLADARRIIFGFVDGIAYVVAGLALIPFIVVGAIVTVVFTPVVLVVMGILMASDETDRAGYRAAGLPDPEEAQAEDAISPDTTLADLQPDESEPAGEIASELS